MVTSLKLQKRLAASILKCGKRKVRALFFAEFGTCGLEAVDRGCALCAIVSAAPFHVVRCVV
jgi:hypothetical protein